MSTLAALVLLLVPVAVLVAFIRWGAWMERRLERSWYLTLENRRVNRWRHVSDAELQAIKPPPALNDDHAELDGCMGRWFVTLWLFLFTAIPCWSAAFRLLRGG
ncbi:MAG: hypothetical protein AB7G21_08145 [Dehalococcoidia bacterium]